MLRPSGLSDVPLTWLHDLKKTVVKVVSQFSLILLSYIPGYNTPKTNKQTNKQKKTLYQTWSQGIIHSISKECRF